MKERADQSVVDNARMQEVSHIGSEQTIRVGTKKTLNDQYMMMNRNMMVKSMNTIERKQEEAAAVETPATRRP